MADDKTSDIADAALSAVLSDTHRAQRLARQALARSDISPEARMTALFALGRSHVELGEPGLAIPFLEQARSLADEGGDEEMFSLISSRLAVALFENGRGDEAVRMLERAIQTGSDQARGTALNAQGIILVHRGRLLAGKDSFDQAVVLLESAGDVNMVVRALASRGTAQARLGNLAGAEADLERSTELAKSLGMAAVVAGNLHNLGYVRSQRGMIPEALEAYEQARQGYDHAGAPARAVAILDTDAAETLLSAGLHDEALAAAERTLAEAHASGHAIQEAESQLLRARILFGAGRLGECVDVAASAAELFERSDRGPWAGQANYLRLQAESDENRNLEDMRAIIAELESHGWESEVQHLLTLLSRSLLQAGDVAGAADALDRAASHRTGSAVIRASVWHAQALLRVAEGNRAGALRALRSGLGVLDEYRAALGATELRVRTGMHARELSELGLSLALDAGRPTDALRWIENGRAQALRTPPARPPRDETLASDLAELRQLHADAREAVLSGANVTAVDQQIATVERRVREHARLARGFEDSLRGRIDVPALRQRLDERVLVEFFESDGQIGAAIVNTTRVRLVDVCPVAEAESVLDSLMFSLRQLAAGRGSPASLEAAIQGLDQSAAELNDLLSGALPEHNELVVVPCASLQVTPWQLLPSLKGHPVATAPSAMIWMRQRSKPSRPVSTRIVAGPGLPAAAREARGLHEMYDGSEVLVGAEATAEASLAAAAAADLLHIAAHGTFRADSPMFSALHMVDGPLTIYDIERLESVPQTVVLSACHAGATEVFVGNEVMGTAMALVGMGVQSVVAPLVAVADEATATVMLAMHSRMREGEAPHEALAHLIRDWSLEDPTLAATAGAFVVIGSDSQG